MVIKLVIPKLGVYCAQDDVGDARWEENQLFFSEFKDLPKKEVLSPSKRYPQYREKDVWPSDCLQPSPSHSLYAVAQPCHTSWSWDDCLQVSVLLKFLP